MYIDKRRIIIAYLVRFSGLQPLSSSVYGVVVEDGILDAEIYYECIVEQVCLS